MFLCEIRISKKENSFLSQGLLFLTHTHSAGVMEPLPWFTISDTHVNNSECCTYNPSETTELKWRNFSAVQRDSMYSI